MDILIATSNPGKFREISKFLKDKNIKLLSLRDFPKIDPPEENGATFQENALIKAKYYAEKFHISVVADDGGLEIDALNGEPGVKSRRWIDGLHESTDEELISYCLKKLKGEKNRKAKLTACLCLYLIDTKRNNVGAPLAGALGRRQALPLQKNIIFVTESIAGVITEEPSNTRFPGFPFRAVLWIPKIKKFYNEDELTEEETRLYNHRYKAVVKIKHELEKYF